jgi:hypothetical protein
MKPVLTVLGIVLLVVAAVYVLVRPISCRASSPATKPA